MIRLFRNASRAGVFGVSLATDHSTTDALLRSRRIISCNWLVALASVAGFSHSIIQ